MTQRFDLSIVGTSSEDKRFNIHKVLTNQLGTYLKEKYNISIFGFRKEGISAESHSIIRRFYMPAKPNPVQKLGYNFSTLRRLLLGSDVSLFLSTRKSLLFPLFKLFPKKKVIVYIDKSQWQKKSKNGLDRLRWGWREKLGVKMADQIVVEHSYLAYYIKETYKKECLTIPFGGDHIKEDYVMDRQFSFSDRDYVLGIATESNPDEVEWMLKGVTRITDFHFVILGNWQANERMEELYERYSEWEQVHLLDIETMKNSFDALRKGAILYIHHHRSDTTHPLILEMMSLGRAVVALDTTMNRETTKENAVYYKDETSLFKALSEMDYGERVHIGESMNRIIESYHKWGNISSAFDQLFHDLLVPPTFDEGGGEALLLEEKF